MFRLPAATRQTLEKIQEDKLNSDIRLEEWNGYQIRFVWKDDDWWAVAKDVAEALGYDHTPHMIRQVDSTEKGVHKVDTLGGKQQMAVLTELGIYDCIFGSNKPEAKQFKRWVYSIIKSLRQAANLEGFEVFRMLDKEHQKAAMDRLKNALNKPSKVDYIIANTIADKAVSTRYGHPKMVRKADMSPAMLQDREAVLDDTVQLMALNEKYHLGLSVSSAIYAGNEKAN